ncbi:hypothetical protein JSCD2_35800 [Clostridioides difficile]|nr:hypothetical protein JSCD2_35800 [Clostridioides difficile]
MCIRDSSTPDLACIKILAPDGSIIQLMSLFIFLRKFPDFVLYLSEQVQDKIREFTEE